MNVQNLDIFGGYGVIRNYIKQNPLCSERKAEWMKRGWEGGGIHDRQHERQSDSDRQFI